MAPAVGARGDAVRLRGRPTTVQAAHAPSTVPAGGGELVLGRSRRRGGWDFVVRGGRPPRERTTGTRSSTRPASPGGHRPRMRRPPRGASVPPGITAAGRWVRAAGRNQRRMVGGHGASDGWEHGPSTSRVTPERRSTSSITYVSDYLVQLDGRRCRRHRRARRGRSTSFEDDGDVFDGWTSPALPREAPGNADDWTVDAADGPPPLGAIGAASLARQPEVIALEGDLRPVSVR